MLSVHILAGLHLWSALMSVTAHGRLSTPAERRGSRPLPPGRKALPRGFERFNAQTEGLATSHRTHLHTSVRYGH